MLPLVSGEIAEDITQYYAVSEQIPTVIATGSVGGQRPFYLCAGGYLIQLLPGASRCRNQPAGGKPHSYGKRCRHAFQKTSLEEMMNGALCGFEPEVLEGSSVCYACDCSREQVERALVSLGREELQRLAVEEPVAKVSCGFSTRNTA